MKDQKIRWGILGTANIATKVASAIQKSKNAELIAIASRELDRAKAWADQHNVEKAYGTYDDLLDDDDLDAIYIPLPPSIHAEWTIRSAEHGKHVLCEKPLCTTIGEANGMEAVCSANGVQLMDGVMWVHHDRTAKMKEILNSDQLGDLRRVITTFTVEMSKIDPNNIRVIPDLGGGSLGDLGYYCVRLILWAFGDLPTKVFATARDLNGVDLNFSAMLWFDRDRMASFDCGFDVAFRQWFEIAGTKGSIVCDDFVIPKSEESSRFWIHSGRENIRHQIGPCVQEIKMIEDFSRIVQSGEIDENPIRDAISTVKICDALRRSAQTHEIVEIN